MSFPFSNLCLKEDGFFYLFEDNLMSVMYSVDFSDGAGEVA